jgi:hypothetical protein
MPSEAKREKDFRYFNECNNEKIPVDIIKNNINLISFTIEPVKYDISNATEHELKKHMRIRLQYLNKITGNLL